MPGLMDIYTQGANVGYLKQLDHGVNEIPLKQFQKPANPFLCICEILIALKRVAIGDREMESLNRWVFALVQQTKQHRKRNYNR